MEIFKQIPNINFFKEHEELKNYRIKYNDSYFTNTIRNSIDQYRNNIKTQNLDNINLSDIFTIIHNNFSKSQYNLQRVINGTGTIIHTNLGRSVLSKNCVENLVEIASNYSNAEYDLNAMKRGSRYDSISDLVCKLTGAEDVVVVNNNAAAVLLTLTSLVTNSEAIISRGELVEIGGSFRIPEIMKYSNTTLNEVGTTNRTHLNDYVDAISENSKAILKVHTSNYKIVGFTSSVSINEIVKVCEQHNLISIEDIGSGSLINFKKFCNIEEPTIQDSIKAGVDIVTFSGDKLLGGVQAGFIIGKKSYIDIIKKNNLLRALRVDKLTLAAIEATLNEYINELEAINNIPTLRMITEKPEEVEKRAKKLLKLLNSDNYEIRKSKAVIGGGSLPTEEINSYKLVIKGEYSVNTLYEKLHQNSIPIITKIENNQIIIDLKAIINDDIAIIARALNE